jgi:hypothetical protein
MVINHGFHGGRTIVAARNGRMIVSTGGREGYVERPYLNRGGRMYYQRTYVEGGRTYARVYRGYNYRGMRYYGYVPVHYYHPAFYGWAYSPWPRPIYYTPATWGWVGTPWYGFYGGYFTPYPVYPAPAFWLTDYVIAANIQAGYQANVAANQQVPGGQPDQNQPDYGQQAGVQTPLSPDVKQQITDEVKQQLEAEQQAAQNPQNPQPEPGGAEVPDALSPTERVFVVSNDIDTADQSGQECGLSGGDVLERLTDMPDANQTVTARVVTSKQGSCGAGQTVAVSVQDLQEMHNQFQQQLDTGLQTLADKGGAGNLPSPPDVGTTPGDVPPPAPDPGAANELQAELTQADQIESQVQSGSTISM